MLQRHEKAKNPISIHENFFILSLTGTSYFVYFPGSYQNLGAISKDSKAMSVTKAENSESLFLLGSYTVVHDFNGHGVNGKHGFNGKKCYDEGFYVVNNGKRAV